MMYQVSDTDASRFLRLSWPQTTRWVYVKEVPKRMLREDLDQLNDDSLYGRGRLLSIGGIIFDDDLESTVLITSGDVNPNEVPLTDRHFLRLIGYLNGYLDKENVIRIERTEGGYHLIMPEINVLSEDLGKEVSSLIDSLK